MSFDILHFDIVRASTTKDQIFLIKLGKESIVPDIPACF